MKIEWDKENNTITVGDAVFPRYMRFPNSAIWANTVLLGNNLPRGLNIYTKNLKEANKAASDALGCSRTVLFKHFNTLQLKVFVAPVYDILKKVAFSGRGFSPRALHMIHRSKGILEEVYNDGLYNILPIVCETGLSPKELKAELKSVWKVISKNSLHKNKALAKAARSDHDIIRMQQIAHLPTSVLQNFGSSTPTEMAWIAEHFKGSWNKPTEINKHTRLFREAHFLAAQLGQEVNPKWTPRRVTEEHDRMSKEITARKYSKDVFDSVRDIPVKSLKSGKYVAKLLDNAFSIADEGNAMGHCVAGYSDSVRQGSYLVYSVTKDGGRSSTIGVNKGNGYSYHNQLTGKTHVDTPAWKLQQQYGRYNAHVTDEEEHNLAQTIVEQLNKAFAHEKEEENELATTV